MQHGNNPSPAGAIQGSHRPCWLPKTCGFAPQSCSCPVLVEGRPGLVLQLCSPSLQGTGWSPGTASCRAAALPATAASHLESLGTDPRLFPEAHGVPQHGLGHTQLRAHGEVPRRKGSDWVGRGDRELRAGCPPPAPVRGQDRDRLFLCDHSSAGHPAGLGLRRHCGGRQEPASPHVSTLIPQSLSSARAEPPLGQAASILQTLVPAHSSCPILQPVATSASPSPLTPALSLGSLSRPPAVGPGTSLPEALLARALPAPALQAASSREDNRTARFRGQCPGSMLRPESSQIRTLGASHWGTPRSTRSPLFQPGCHILSQCHTPPRNSIPETLQEGNSGSFHSCSCTRLPRPLCRSGLLGPGKPHPAAHTPGWAPEWEKTCPDQQLLPQLELLQPVGLCLQVRPGS
ncbi:uncharacterized protein ACIB01_013352 [Guaruba guarouba]